MMNPADLKVLHTQSDIQSAIQNLKQRIETDYLGLDLMLIGILNGAFIFLADLCRVLEIPHKIDFMGASSYGDKKSSSGLVKITKYPDASPKGKHILLIEDVIETGSTLHKIKKYLLEEGAESVKICSLVVKKKKGRASLPVDYFGFDDGDSFLIGYGLDYAGMYRNLPFIAELEDSNKRSKL